MPKSPRHETLRSSFTLDGTRVFLIHDADKAAYRLATRWVWLSSYPRIEDACDAFEALEALELMSGNEKRIAGFLTSEIKRVPRHRFGSARNTMGRINYLINCAEHRMKGQRLVICGSKGAVERWDQSGAGSLTVAM
jgi:hypothetical protein